MTTAVPVTMDDQRTWEDRYEVCEREIDDCRDAILETNGDPTTHEGYKQLCKHASDFMKTSPGTSASNESFSKFVSYKHAIHEENDTAIKQDPECLIATYTGFEGWYGSNPYVQQTDSVNAEYQKLCKDLTALKKTEPHTADFKTYADSCKKHIDSIDEAIMRAIDPPRGQFSR